MQRRICLVILFFAHITNGFCADGESAVNLYRLYDFTPISTANPVVASVKADGIAVPVSELRAYVNAIPTSDGSVPRLLTLNQKRAMLEKLLDDHFLMWAGYRQKAEQTPDIIHKLEITQSMLLRETLVTQEAGDKAKTPEEYRQVYQKLCDRIFNQTNITISNESYAELKATIKRLKLTTEVSIDISNLNLDKLAPSVRNRVFAKSKVGFVTIGDVLTYYVQIPVAHRPDLDQQDGVDKILEQMLRNSLLTEEARTRGLEKAPIVLEKMQLNRNMMVRMYALNQIAVESVARSKEPGENARVKQWYQNHLKDRYTYKDAQGKEQVTSFDEQHERIEDDYIDDLREQIRVEHIGTMRNEHKIEINEKVLKQVVLESRIPLSF